MSTVVASRAMLPTRTARSSLSRTAEAFAGQTRVALYDQGLRLFFPGGVLAWPPFFPPVADVSPNSLNMVRNVPVAPGHLWFCCQTLCLMKSLHPTDKSSFRGDNGRSQGWGSA